MWSYGAGHEEGQLPSGLSAEVQRLAVLKAKAVSRGDLRGAKKHEYQLKKLMHQHGVLYKGGLCRHYARPGRPAAHGKRPAR